MRQENKRMKSITFQNFIDCQNAGTKNALRQNKCIGKTENQKEAGPIVLRGPLAPDTKTLGLNSNLLSVERHLNALKCFIMYAP